MTDAKPSTGGFPAMAEQDPARASDGGTVGPPTQSGPRRWVIGLAVVVGALVLSIGLVLTQAAMNAERIRLEEGARARAQAVLSGRLDRLSDWLDSRRESLSALAGGEALRIIATELHTARLEDRDAEVSSELGFLRAALERQANAFGAAGLILAHPDGVPWLVAGKAGGALADRRGDGIAEALHEGGAVVAADVGGSSDAVDALVPVFSLQQPDQVVGLIIGRFPITELIEALEQPGALALPGERVSVVWSGESGLNPGQSGGEGAVMSLTHAPKGLPWALRYSRPRKAYLTESRATGLAGQFVSAAAAVTAVMLIMGVAWRQGTQSNRAMADQYRRFADHMAAEHQILDTIVDGITEYLFMIDSRGRVQRANAAARTLLGVSADGLTGRTLADIFDDPEVPVLLLDRTPEGRRSAPVECGLAGERRWITAVRNRLPPIDTADERWVVLVQDITDVMRERIRLEDQQKTVIRALGRTVSAADPYLADQAARLEWIAGLIADEMGVGGEARQTIELTAQVSQIGKLFVPRDLLTKVERLTDEERLVIQSHIRHASTLLDQLNTALPITRTLLEVTERLDGSGYPNGLTEEELSLPGRILAVADVFSARTARRSYRSGATPKDILEILKKMPDRYDEDVVAALSRIVESGRY
ncbi:HD domain-containing phosphohydrolase [Rhodospira trueperi]|uniref:PAS domain S-box-containing protein n=1 Tax=Rhodospira trueperi TaxID=69960 RepID=A0A1G7FTS5_9PROT|nr:HD domain-containing phosphohydrolase [Rhodospira trueperi]SDE79286.1 PAS domain S-box-containing protein [Rhodospira trueperi]